MWKIVFHCAKCQKDKAWYQGCACENKLKFCDECGTKLSFISENDESKQDELKQEQETKASIEATKKQLEGSQVSLRKELNPSCLTQGHYCATSKKDGDICLRVASEKTVKDLKHVGLEATFEASLCSKNPYKGKKRFIEETEAEDLTEEEKKQQEEERKKTEDWINNVNNRTTTIHPTFEQAMKIKAIMEGKTVISEEEKTKLREEVKAEFEAEREKFRVEKVTLQTQK